MAFVASDPIADRDELGIISVCIEEKDPTAGSGLGSDGGGRKGSNEISFLPLGEL